MLCLILTSCGDAARPTAWLTRRGEALVDAGKFSAAIEVLKEATQQNPNDAEAWFQLGRAHEGMGDLPAALESYETATRAKRDHSEAWRHLGMLYGNMGRSAEAWEVMHQLARIHPDAAAILAEWLRARFPQQMRMQSPHLPLDQ
jgi:tetratricopeptide (TPR) repeat protein